MENDQNKKKKWILIGVGIVVLIVIIVILLLRFGKETTVAKQIGNILPFGQLGDEGSRGNISGGNGGEGGVSNENSTPEGKPMFLQLAKGPVAGATSVTRDGKAYVRYILRENGFIYEVDPETAESRQLTNTTIPRVYEAAFGNNGNSVVLRYLKRDSLSRIDVIKTYIANLDLPLSTDSSAIGTLRGEYLTDNISSLTVSPDGKNLFYLLPISEGVSGTIVSFSNALPPKEVFRNSFSEWLPQLYNDGKILLTTKASAKVPGFAYLYNPKDKSLSRVLREKMGLTTKGNSDGTLVAYNENISDNPTFGLYSKEAFSSELGSHEFSVPLTTLPEKCAWGTVNRVVYCGAFQSTGNIPDSWYQGDSRFADTFWSVNTDTTEISLIADPQDAVKRSFDILMPFIDQKEIFLFFVDKNDSSLWSMRIPTPTNSEDETPLTIDPNLSPEEQKDAVGSRTN